MSTNDVECAVWCRNVDVFLFVYTCIFFITKNWKCDISYFPLFLQLSKPEPSFPPQILQPFWHLSRQPVSSSPSLQNLQPSWKVIFRFFSFKFKLLYLFSWSTLVTFCTAVAVRVCLTILTFVTYFVQKTSLFFLSIGRQYHDGENDSWDQHKFVHPVN